MGLIKHNFFPPRKIAFPTCPWEDKDLAVDASGQKNTGAGGNSDVNESILDKMA